MPTANAVYFESIINFKPEEVIDKISPRPIFFQHLVVDCEESAIMYEKAREPKKLWILPESDVPTHSDVYKGCDGGPGFFNTVMQVTIDWLKQYITPRG